MSDPYWRLLTLRLDPAQESLVTRAAGHAWRNAVVQRVATLDAALAHAGAPGREILVLGRDVPAGETERAAEVLDEDGLPRWSVIVWGGTAGAAAGAFVYPDFTDVAPEGLAAFLTVVAARHAAVRAAARDRGDLRTIARRVSHEMRSPLGSILTSVDVLREELEDQPGIVEGLLQPIVESASDMIKLLDRLSLVARASAMPAKSGPVEMGVVVWSAQERLAKRIAAAGATITEPETWPEVWGVPGWLEHVWETLLANALDHTGDGNPAIEVGWEEGEGELRFFVRDHGQGVAPAVQRLLFRPFHQLHQTDSGRATGLAVVQRLIEIQGGRCGYAPVEPHGACFYFTLPAKAPIAAAVS